MYGEIIDSNGKSADFSCIPHSIEIRIRIRMKILNSVSFSN